MWLACPKSARLAQRFGLLSVLAILLTLPYAVPAFWDYVQMRMGWERGYYLLKPVENQVFYVQLAVLASMIPYCLWRAFAPPAGYPRNSLTYLALVFVALQVGSAFVSTNAEYSLRQLLMPFACLAVFLVIPTLGMGRRDMEKVFLVPVIGVIPLALYAVAQSQGWEFLPYAREREVAERMIETVSGKQLTSSTFGHPNYLASYLSPMFFWSMYFALTRKPRVQKLLGGAALMSIVASLLVGGTRGGWVAVVAAGLPFYVLLTLSPAYRRQLLFTGGIVVLVVVAVLVIPNPLVRVQFNLADRVMASKEITSRFYYWLMSIEMLKDSPWLGVGFAHFDVRFWEYVDLFQRRPEADYYRFILTDSIRGVRPGFVHNDFLQIAAESGVFAVLTWLAMWSALVCQTWETARRLRNNPRSLLLSATFLAAFLAMAVDGLFNFPMHIPVSRFLFWVMLGTWIVLRSDVAAEYREAEEAALAAAEEAARKVRPIPRIRPGQQIPER